MTGLDRDPSKERGKARIVRPNRSQLSWDQVDPEDWLPSDHIARLVSAAWLGVPEMLSGGRSEQFSRRIVAAPSRAACAQQSARGASFIEILSESALKAEALCSQSL